MDEKTDQNLIEEKDNKNNNLLKSIEILSEMTKADIERSSYNFDTNLKLVIQSQ